MNLNLEKEKAKFLKNRQKCFKMQISYKNLPIIHQNYHFKKWARIFIFNQLSIQLNYCVDQLAFSPIICYQSPSFPATLRMFLCGK